MISKPIQAAIFAIMVLNGSIRTLRFMSKAGIQGIEYTCASWPPSTLGINEIVHTAARKVTATAYQPTLLRRILATRGINNEPAKGIAQHSHAASSAGTNMLVFLRSLVFLFGRLRQVSDVTDVQFFEYGDGKGKSHSGYAGVNRKGKNREGLT